MFTLSGKPGERDFLNRIMERSGQNLLACLQCGKCTGSCPIASEHVGGPRRLIAEILLGMTEAALSDPTWWYCVSCGSCVTRCPVDINTYEVATALCEEAHKRGIKPSEPDIHRFEDLFLKSVKKYGRVKELRTVALFNLLSGQPFKDMDKGLTLMRNGAVSPLEIVMDWKKDERIARIFERAERSEDGD